MTLKKPKPGGLSSMRARATGTQGGNATSKNPDSAHLGVIKNSISSPYYMRFDDENMIVIATREASYFLEPLSVTMLVEAVYLLCNKYPALMDRFKAAIPDLEKDAIQRAGDYRRTTIRLDKRVFDWLSFTTSQSRFTAICFFIRWIAADWAIIREYFPHALASSPVS